MIQTYTLRDRHQPIDHGGDPVAPLASDGTPFDYAWRRDEQRLTIYATTADALLAEIIPGYNPRLSNDATTHDRLEDQRLDQRARHALGVVTTHAAQAMIAGVDDDIVATLQRATDYTRPLDHAELPDWNHDIPLVLIDAFYGPGQHQAPAGNVIMLRVGDPDDYLHDLATVGVITLWEHSQVTSPLLHASIAIDPDPANSLQPRLNSLDQALEALRGEASATNEHHVRTRTAALLNTLDAAPQPGIDPDAIRRRITTVGEDRKALQRVVNRYLSRALHNVVGETAAPTAETPTPFDDHDEEDAGDEER